MAIKQSTMEMNPKLSSPGRDSDQDDLPEKPSPSAPSPVKKILLIVAAVLVVLALALGLGLGLGLRNSSKSASNSPQVNSTHPTPAAQDSHASEFVPSWRSHVNDYNLDLANWDLDAAPTTREYHLALGEATIAPDGVPRQVLTINGGFPGPLIRANRGDRLLVHVQNGLSNATSIHWHGMFQNGTNWMDGTSGITQCGIPPGSAFTYNFTIPNQYGTYWYHSHYSTQYSDGLVGPLIIHAPEEKVAQEGYDFDQVVLVSDWYHDFSQVLLPEYLASGNENNEPVPDNGLIQSTNYFNCSSLESDSGFACYDNSSRAVFNVEQNKRYRYRLINTGSFATFQFSIDNHPLSLIEADGTAVQPMNVHRFEIAVAQRYSFILHANQTPSNYWIRSQMNTFCFAVSNGVLDADVRALLTYTNNTASPTISTDWSDAVDVNCIDLNVTEMVPLHIKNAPPADVIYAITSSFQTGAYALDRAYINGSSWSMSSVPTLNQAVSGLHAGNSNFSTAGISSAFSANQYVIDVPKSTVVDLLVSNFDDGAHPFHLHGHQFWIVASSSDQYLDWSTYPSLNQTLENRMHRDTMVVDAYGWNLIRFEADNPGLWAFHCHIVWHMEAGLLMQFQTRDDIMSTWTLPSDVLALCRG